MKKITTKIISWIVGSALLLHVIVLLVFYFFEDNLIFQRKALPQEYSFKFEPDAKQEKYEEYFIKTYDGETLNALLFKTKLRSKGLILYFHGNADNLQRWGKYSVDFTRLGFDILMVDYRGYGKSTGVPIEHDLYKDALTVLRWAQDSVKHIRLIIYGRSLGTAVASNLATAVTPDLLILETPFDELTGAIYKPLKSLLYFLPLHSKFSNKAFLPKVTCRKVIIHGTKDQVVPLASASRLKPLLVEGDDFVIIEGGSHRNLRDFKSFHRALAEALK
ncbi:MAG: alpha/beta hydrolase [Bacteroidia bacterium]|nr:alpha/beta hydrolase [Bacteroidia bacterium]